MKKNVGGLSKFDFSNSVVFEALSWGSILSQQNGPGGRKVHTKIKKLLGMRNETLHDKIWVWHPKKIRMHDMACLMGAIFHISNTLFEKSNFCPKIQFWQNPNIFTSFSPNFFWQFFSWNQSCQQLKSSKPQHFHEFFTKKNRQFFREIKVEFLEKNWRFLRTVFKNSV